MLQQINNNNYFLMLVNLNKYMLNNYINYLCYWIYFNLLKWFFRKKIKFFKKKFFKKKYRIKRPYFLKKKKYLNLFLIYKKKKKKFLITKILKLKKHKFKSFKKLKSITFFIYKQSSFFKILQNYFKYKNILVQPFKLIPKTQHMYIREFTRISAIHNAENKSISSIQLYKSIFWYLKDSRNWNWNLITYKTIKQRRYNKFFKEYIYYKQTLNPTFSLYIYLFKLPINWKLSILIQHLILKLLYNIKMIIIFPIITLLKKIEFKFKFLYKKWYKKIKKFKYIKFKHILYPWYTKKSYNMYIYKYYNWNKNTFYWKHIFDAFTNVLYIPNYNKLTVPKYLNNENINYLFKLYKYRYKV